MGVRRAVLGGVHLRRDALRPRQEPRGGGARAARPDPAAAPQLSQLRLRGGEPAESVTCDLWPQLKHWFSGDEIMLGNTS